MSGRVCMRRDGAEQCGCSVQQRVLLQRREQEPDAERGAVSERTLLRGGERMAGGVPGGDVQRRGDGSECGELPSLQRGASVQCERAGKSGRELHGRMVVLRRGEQRDAE